jgi:glycyl-tRNA synthetase
VKNNVLSLWRQHFIVEESMLELEATCLTPEAVLRASGHVDKFTDLMVRDSIIPTECFRADHLLRDHLDALLEGRPVGPAATGKKAKKAAEPEPLSPERATEITALRERIDEIDAEEMDQHLAKYGVVAPETGNPVTKAFPFNLMFPTQIGPTGLLQGYLRPETAQGIFVNFKRLYDYAAGKLPFACAQIGLSFRNEISPQAGLLRVREFMQAEIEHFVDPRCKDHPKFASIAGMKINLYGRRQQLTTFEPEIMTIGEAVTTGVVANETLGYFIARTNAFVEKLGLTMRHVRFRQHLEHEMAHYAADCWDLEVRCSYKWVECAGLADRSAYDLSVHSKASKIELSAFERFAEVQEVSSLVAIPNKGLMGRAFKKDAQPVMAVLSDMSEDQVKAVQSAFESDGKTSVTTSDGAAFEITKDMVSFKVETTKLAGENFYPSVVEPSFGIGRLLYCLWEHVLYVREGEREENAIAPSVLRMPPPIAPVKCAVLPLSKNDQFNPMLAQVQAALSTVGLINRVDDGAQSIGRRYARADEIGTPFGITVDFTSLEDGSVTVRERDSMKQVRCSVPEAVNAIRDMVFGSKTWDDISAAFPAFSS